jgi:hypothetical protein
MSDKSLAIQIAERKAFERLAKKYHKQVKTTGVKDKDGKIHQLPVAGANGHPVTEYVGNYWHVDPNSITCPSALIQELPLDGTTNTLSFVFNQNAPPQSPTLNNILLGVNDVFVMYGIQVLFGVGAVGVSRQYYTHGLLAADNALYQGSNMAIQFEQNQAVKNIDMTEFKYDETTDFKPEEAITLINPLRLLTGRLGTWTVSINMQSLTGLTFTPNAYVRVALRGVLGQAGGK